MTEKSQSKSSADPERIWHFTSFPALLSILQRRQLWFTTLAELEDPFEGRAASLWYKKLSVKQHEDLVRMGSVHCWHIAQVDSDLMWKVYAPNFGVAIQSTVEKLRASFRDPVECKPVKYSGSSFNPDPFQKRQHFEGEREFRAYLPKEKPSSCIYLPESDIQTSTGYPSEGGHVDIAPASLIEDIHVSPHAPPWFREVVQEAVNRQDYRRPIKCRSDGVCSQEQRARRPRV